MNKKHLIIVISAAAVLILAIIIILVIGSLNRENELKADTPDNLAKMARQAIADDDYLAFQELFTSQTKEKVTKEGFSEIAKIMTEGVLYSNYTLLRLENGRMVLIYMSGPDSEGLYQIQDVKIVPDSMYGLFNH